MDQNNIYDVIVIGAGASGVGCGLNLQKSGLNYIILEAQDKVGGRCQTINGVDHGASWIHNFLNPKNPIKEYLSDESILIQAPAIYSYYDESEGEVDEKEVEKSEDIIEKFIKRFEKKVKNLVKDVLIYELMSDQIAKYQQIKSKLLKRLVNLQINMLENFEAASFSELSAANGLGNDDAEDFYIDPDSHEDNIILQIGNGDFIKKLSKDLKIQLNTVVKEIYYKHNDVKIKTMGGEFRCRKIVITASLGVLKKGGIQFCPPLPPDKTAAIQMLGFGLMNKIIIQFQEQFWKDVEWLHFSAEEKGRFPMFFNCNLTKQNTLMGFITDDYARSIEKKSDEEVRLEVIQFMEKCMKQKLPAIEKIEITRWGQKEHVWGSYSHFAVGSSIQNQKDLGEPIFDTVYFAGEATSVEFMGTVAGAFGEGIKCAKLIEQIFKK